MFVDVKYSKWKEILQLVSFNRRNEYFQTRTCAVKDKEKALQAKISVVNSTKVQVPPAQT